ncbi:MAG: phosphoribosylglycinamide formyltransferase [Acidimicrobiia bacterium]|nr:phosphoribosylglycinamide formyltransferase [Acidimicrobiia bacterium]
MAHPPERRLPVAVLVSGSGSNLQAIIDAADAPSYGAEIVAVISDRPGVRALERAATAGIPSEVVAWKDFDNRAAFSAAICDAADAYGADALILAGFMRILAPNAIARFPNRILNTHPALLPAFPGAHAVPEAIAHGVKLTGVTIHFVDEEVDHGPIIRQVAVAIESGDTEATLQARIQAEEHRVYPEVIDAFARGRLEVLGRAVTWKEPV